MLKFCKAFKFAAKISHTPNNKVSYNLLLKIMNDVDIKKNCISKDLIFQALKQINNVEDESTLTQIFIKNIIYDGYVTLHSTLPIIIL